jgi:hypothetical protein
MPVFCERFRECEPFVAEGVEDIGNIRCIYGQISLPNLVFVSPFHIVRPKMLDTMLSLLNCMIDFRTPLEVEP